jgi:ATP-binding cassette subfamily B protein
MLAWVLPLYERGRAAYDRLYEIYSEPIEVSGEKDSNLSIPESADIEFRNLSFTYPLASEPALKNFSLSIKGKSFIGITGPVGSGKTTLFRLLAREYEIPYGKIFINGQDIRNYPLEAFNQQIAIVEQSPFLFSRPIVDNLRFGREDASMAEIESVARHADIHETILEFPEQYDTLVGERGLTLSGGQKQRVAIARAFLVDRFILLLDDVFSAIDAKTEQRIFESLKAANSRGKTIILITHRIALLNAADRVIYMDHGQVIEDGPPSQLLSKQGHYAALAALQKYE